MDKEDIRRLISHLQLIRDDELKLVPMNDSERRKYREEYGECDLVVGNFKITKLNKPLSIYV